MRKLTARLLTGTVQDILFIFERGILEVLNESRKVTRAYASRIGFLNQKSQVGRIPKFKQIKNRQERVLVTAGIRQNLQQALCARVNGILELALGKVFPWQRFTDRAIYKEQHRRARITKGLPFHAICSN